MSLRKMCIVLSIIALATALTGVWMLHYGAEQSKIDGEVPGDLAGLSESELRDGKGCAINAGDTWSYVSFIAESASQEEHLLRFYPVSYRSDPKKYVLVCVPKDDFPKWEKRAGGSAKETVKLTGILRKNGAAETEAVRQLAESLTAVDPQGKDYSELFLPYYVEIVVKPSNGALKILGIVMAAVGFAAAVAGCYGIVRPGDAEQEDESAEDENMITEETTEQNGQ